MFYYKNTCPGHTNMVDKNENGNTSVILWEATKTEKKRVTSHDTERIVKNIFLQQICASCKDDNDCACTEAYTLLFLSLSLNHMHS